MLKLLAKPLTREQIQNLVQAKVDWIVHTCNPRQVILFGSAARNEMTEASDIDLIVIVDDNENTRAMHHLLAKTRPKDSWAQDLILVTQSEFVKKVQKGGGACWIANSEGITVYQRKTNEP